MRATPPLPSSLTWPLLIRHTLIIFSWVRWNYRGNYELYVIQYQVYRTKGGCPCSFISVLCRATPLFHHYTGHACQFASESVLLIANRPVWAHPLEYTLLVSGWYRVDGKRVCLARTCTVTDREHSHCNGVSTPARQGPIKPSCCHKHSILAKIGHLGIQTARSTHGQINSFWMCVTEWGNILKPRTSNSVGEIILLPQDSSCHIEVNMDMANKFNVYRIELLGLSSARRQAPPYGAESAGFPVDAQDFWRVWN